MPGELTPWYVPMIPDAVIVALSGSVSNHWSRKSAALIVISWTKTACWRSGSAWNARARPASGSSGRGSRLRQVGRRDRQDRLDEAGHLDHELAVFLVRLGVGRRPAAQLADRPAVVVDPPEVVAARASRSGVNVPSSGRMSRPWRGSSSSRMISGRSSEHDVREDREPEAREQLLGDGRAAQDVALLEDERLHPGPGQVRGADQAVVAAADDDRVVALGQPLPPRPHARSAEGPRPSLSDRRVDGTASSRRWPRCAPCRASSSRLPDARPPTAPPPDRRPRDRLPRRPRPTGRSGRPSTSRRCARRSAGRCPTAARRPARSSTTSRAIATRPRRDRRAALLRVRRRRRRAGRARRRLADERLGPERRAVRDVAGRRRSPRRSPAAGWSTLFGLPEGSSVGFTTGATMATFTALAAGRHRVLERAGWNVEDGRLRRRAADRGRRRRRGARHDLRLAPDARARPGRGSTASRPTSRAGCAPDALRETLAGLDGPIDRLRPVGQREHRRVRPAAGDRRRRPRAAERLAPRRRRVRAVGGRGARAPRPRRRPRRRRLVDDRRPQVAQRAVRLGHRDRARRRGAPRRDDARRGVLRRDGRRRARPVQLGRRSRRGGRAASPSTRRCGRSAGSGLAEHDRALLRARAPDGRRPARRAGRDDPQRRRAQPGPRAVRAARRRRRRGDRRLHPARHRRGPGRRHVLARRHDLARAWPRCGSRSRTGRRPRPTPTSRSRRSCAAPREVAGRTSA